MRRALLILTLMASPAFGSGQVDPLPILPRPAAAPVPAARAVATSRPAYPSGSVVYVDATGSKTAWPLQFAVVGRPDEPRMTLDGGTGVIYPALPDGTYFIAVTASSPVEGQPPAVDTAVVPITVGLPPAPAPRDNPDVAAKLDAISAAIGDGFARVLAALPAPGPGPSPTPPAPPAPTPTPDTAAYSGPLYATLIYDKGDIAHPTTAVRISTLRADLAALNATWTAMDSTEAGAAAFLRAMARDGISVPVVYLTDAAGKQWGAAIVAPRSKDEVIAAVRAVRGGR